MKYKKLFAGYGIILSLLFLSLNFSPAVYGISFTPSIFTDSVDVNPGDGVCADNTGECSLRAAVMESNVLSGADIINLNSGTYILSIDGAHGVDSEGDLFITDDLEIIGASSGVTQIDNQMPSFATYTMSARANNLVLGDLDLIRSGNSCNLGFFAEVPTNGIYNYTLNNINISDCDIALVSLGPSFSSNPGAKNSFEINNSNFSGNRTGVSLIESDAIINDTNIDNNTLRGVYARMLTTDAVIRINNSTINDNSNTQSTQSGSGIYLQEDCFNSFGNSNSMYLTNVDISRNSSVNAGGIHNFCGHLVLDKVTLSNNISDTNGAGIYSTYSPINIDGNAVQADAEALLDIKNSTFSGNIAAGRGGAIYLDSERTSVPTTPYTFDMLNTTIANNSSGIEIVDANGNLNNSPVEARIRNTLLVNNNGINCDFDSVLVIDGNSNLSDDISCNSVGVINTDTNLSAYLGDLQDNGGFVTTHELLEGSGAIDAGDNSICPNDDARHVTRPIDADNDGSAICDIGSFEARSFQTAMGSISGRVFLDSNNNGVFDAEDESMANVVVEIYDDNGALVESLTTDEQGRFSANLPIGDYTYRIVEDSLPNQYSYEDLTAGSDSGSFSISGGNATEIYEIGYFDINTNGDLLIRTGGFGIDEI